MQTLTGDIIKAQRLSLICLLTALGFSAAHASGEVRILKDSVVTRFNAADQQLMMDSVSKALLAEQDGAELVWHSDKTRAAGVVTALERYEEQGRSCRKLRIRNEFGKRMDQTVYKFCQTGKNGPWKLLGPDLD